MRLAKAHLANQTHQRKIELGFFVHRLYCFGLLMISRIFAEFANQNAFPANFPKKAAKNRANLKGDSSKINSLFYRFTCYQIRHIWVPRLSKEYECANLNFLRKLRSRRFGKSPRRTLILAGAAKTAEALCFPRFLCLIQKIASCGNMSRHCWYSPKAAVTPSFPASSSKP